MSITWVGLVLTRGKGEEESCCDTTGPEPSATTGGERAAKHRDLVRDQKDADG